MDYHTTEIKTLKHKSIEKLFLSLTCKDLNGVVKKYSNESKLTIYSVREYYYDSISNFKIVSELESLNMRTLSYDNDYNFWLKISENPELFKYLHYNTLHHMWNIHGKYKNEIRLNLDVVLYLLSEIKNEKLILFLQCLKYYFIKLNNEYDSWKRKVRVINDVIFYELEQYTTLNENITPPIRNIKETKNFSFLFHSKKMIVNKTINELENQNL
jgi:hypothetical protein